MFLNSHREMCILSDKWAFRLFFFVCVPCRAGLFRIYANKLSIRNAGKSIVLLKKFPSIYKLSTKQENWLYPNIYGKPKKYTFRDYIQILRFIFVWQ